jgi:tetratricopeptide (TPR) repeat protein
MTRWPRAVLVVALVVLVSPIPGFSQGVSVDAFKLADAGKKALDEKRFADALSSFTAAAKLAPQNPSILFGAGASAFMLAQYAEAERYFERVLQVEPRFKDASLILGELQYRTGRIKEAVATYEAALRYAPNDATLTGMIARWSAEARSESRFSETRGVHFRVLFEGPVDQAVARRAVELLETAYLRVGDELQSYPGAPVEVVLYTEQQFRDVTRAPAWAGGQYDGRIRVPVKGALDRADLLERVLTHEYVHALIASLAGLEGVPAWMDEGLAEALSPGGLPQSERLRAATKQRLALSSLQNGFGGLPVGQVPLAYAEAAVAARAMLDQRGPSAVVMLLRDLAGRVPFDTAFHQRIGIRYEEFQALVAGR